MNTVTTRPLEANTDQTFAQAFRGRFVSLLSWQQLDDFWQVVRQHAGDGWYIYAVGETPPTSPADADGVRRFIDEIDALLHKEHEEDYCGIVYTDSREQPTLIKIFDPNNLGVVCGYSDNPPLPGWVMSHLAPSDLNELRPLPGNRRRWWQAIWSR